VDVKNDQVHVVVDPGPITEEEVLYLIPKIVPGTYSEDNFGSYVEDLQALDYKGRPLEVRQRDSNTWVILGARNLERIRYRVNDTFDTETEVEEPVFSPAGTNILKGENFILNLHGFVGYFKGYQEVPYELSITAPDFLIPSTSLPVSESTKARAGENLFHASRYFEVIDNPIMYSRPNTATFTLEDITVTLSVYSPSGAYTASDLQPKMEAMMRAQKDFLGPLSGTDRYTILLYLAQFSEADAVGFGALEHHTSTLVVLPETLPRSLMEETMVEMVSHEFFHTLTPLSVHSREIQYFDFNEPKMSRHLWMYEGTTEYFANLFQVRQGLIGEEEFYDRISKKISNSLAYDQTMPFTTMSANVLRSPYKENYLNVYEKGALINMCLDLLLREKSNGERGILWLMGELASKYNQDTPFDDPDLISEITAMTYPEVGFFFESYVLGKEPLPYGEFLRKAGLEITEQQQAASHFFIGQIPLIDADPGDLNTIFIQQGMELNSFLRDLGAKGGDVILEVNGTPITLDNMRSIVGESFSWDADKDIRMKMLRDGEELVLEGKAGNPTYIERNVTEMESPSEIAKALRNSWLHP
jgi:predicted metalloprotease with PDZ domain